LTPMQALYRISAAGSSTHFSCPALPGGAFKCNLS
jgi:hypothetical protein